MMCVSGDLSIARRTFIKLAGTHAERCRFPEATPDTMPLMIGDDGCVGIGNGAPPPDKPELEAPLPPTAKIPRNTAALTNIILFLRFII
mmetsp:Transcript_32586/g.96044  ORF Transcript_32586/g.96044 Transcript_32586/m.96044 type:complete len:89 (+) Transcript_32586:1971-2237(+)